MRRERHALVRSLAGLGALLALAASGGAFAAGELRIANSGEPDTLDPHHVSGIWENRIVGDMFMGLTTEAADGSVIPGAAESWQVSDDGLIYTFTLRDHTWSDGTPVTADDFVFALRRILDPAQAAEYASLLYTIKNAEAAQRGRASRAWTSSASRRSTRRRSRSRSRARPPTSSSS